MENGEWNKIKSKLKLECMANSCIFNGKMQRHWWWERNSAVWKTNRNILQFSALFLGAHSEALDETIFLKASTFAPFGFSNSIYRQNLFVLHIFSPFSMITQDFALLLLAVRTPINVSYTLCLHSVHFFDVYMCHVPMWWEYRSDFQLFFSYKEFAAHIKMWTRLFVFSTHVKIFVN